MIHRNFARALVLVQLLAFTCMPAAAAEPKDLKAALDQVRAETRTPALAAAIYRDGALVGVGVVGERSIDSHEPATLDDLFPIGSCAKPMARVVVLRLVDRGVLTLDAGLAQLLDGVPMREDYRAVTLRDLMAHRAGIQPYTEIGPRITPIVFEVQGTAAEQRAKFATHVLSEMPVAKPGSAFAYSNAGFCVIAAVVERKTAKPWEPVLNEEVFGPLGMNSAANDADEPGKPAITGHIQGPDGLRAARAFPPLAVMVPAGGGVRMSIADFAAFAAAQADLSAGRPAAGLSQKTIASMPSIGPGDAGTGGGATYGGDGRYTAAFATWPKQRVAIAVACNVGDSDDACTKAIEAVRAAVAPDIGTINGGGEGPEGAPPADGPRYGFSVKAEAEGTWEIGPVAAGSIAEKAGLKEGDTVVAINGRTLADIPEEERMPLVRANTLTLTLERGGKTFDISMKK